MHCAPFCKLRVYDRVYDRIPAIRSPYPGLYVTGIMFSYPERSINMLLRMGREVARACLEDMENYS